jgi:hypothetical protein
VAQEKNLPSIDYLFQRLDVNATTGELWWRWCGEKPKGWNTKFAGKRAFVSQWPRGYLRGNIDGRFISAHRVIWAMVFGEWPEDEIDHVNGVRTDNRLCNLRAVSKAENARNKRKYATNKTGAPGVQRYRSRWQAFLSNDYLGTLSTFEDALAARKEAEQKCGFHENHGSQRPSY